MINVKYNKDRAAFRNIKKMRTNLSYVIKRVNFWRKTSMYAKELLVHDGGQRQAVEGFHASIINTLGVLDLAYKDKI